MFGIGFQELLVIFVVALLVVGPDKLPELARSLAKGLAELRRSLNEVKGSFAEEEKAVDNVGKELRETAEELRKKVMLDVPVVGELEQAAKEFKAEVADLAVAVKTGTAEEPEVVADRDETARTEQTAPEVRAEIIDAEVVEMPESAPSDSSSDAAKPAP